LFLRAWQDGGTLPALGCGASFAAAYLSRPEAIGVFGLLGVAAVVLRASGARAAGPRSAGAGRAAACAVVFVATCVPYWSYLHDTLGRWTITGRAVDVAPQAMVSAMAPRTGAAENRIETML